jgi:hypothetical protein
VVKKPAEASLSFRSFASPDQSYKLAHAPAGKEITETTLRPVCEALVHMVLASVECRNTSCHLQDSRDFRGAAEDGWKTLQSIGLDGRDLQYVMESNLSRGYGSGCAGYKNRLQMSCLRASGLRNISCWCGVYKLVSRGVLAFSALLILAGLGQVSRPKFEVATIKRSAPDSDTFMQAHGGRLDISRASA